MEMGEFKEILFWKDIPVILENERCLRERFRPDLIPENRPLYDRAVADFIREQIPTKEEFYKRMEDYERDGEPVWVSGRNPTCDDLSMPQLRKAHRNLFRGAERVATVTQARKTWAKHLDFYVGAILNDASNTILELTIGAGFGTAAVVEKMRPDDFYTGVDIDLKCVKNAEGILKYCGKAGVALATSLWNLPFDDGTFSVVCSHLGIDECREIPTILAEAVRVLSPGGKIVLACSNTGLHRTRGYFDAYAIDEKEALECLRRVRHYADSLQIDAIMASMLMVKETYCQFDGRYVSVYTKPE